MADVFTKEQRSQVMRQVKSSRNKSTELKLVTFFKANKIKGWRRNYPVFGKPDFTFLSIKVVVFVDGCFWHGHDCRNTRPKDNADYWTKKRKRNIKRDKEVTQALQNKGWTVIRIWECELRDEKLLKEKLPITSGLASVGVYARGKFSGNLKVCRPSELLCSPVRTPSRRNVRCKRATT